MMRAGLWSGLLGAPVAWLVTLELGYALTPWACNHQHQGVLHLVTLFGLSFPFLLTGAVLVEWVFAWPGMGKLTAEAIFRRDYPVVLAAATSASTMVVLGSLLADVLYAIADPRIRVHGE